MTETPTETPPSRRPAIASTALACVALSRCPDTAATRAARRARRWLRAIPSPPRGSADELIDSALRTLALREEEPVDLSHPRLDASGYAVLSRVVQAVAVHVDLAVVGGAPLGRLAGLLDRDIATGTPCPFTGRPGSPALWAARLLAEHPAGGGRPVREAVARIAAARQDNARTEDELPATALALIALNAAAPGSPAWRRCRAALLRVQLHDGSWRPSRTASEASVA
ncbi:hypothetical protein OG883_13200 [Streptomyces sp. NBC_01142]|uniref:hypothetical protein n=1 Tax=Streptomyces sp. NBC_01142 TaxID=2975865 RepID=UPI002255DE1E|nr:hypothetical protein [Streptomyces sp. NBC_01142]MCX4820847.1 hypothetical protein [Streptomyces sp. NBC_01142]